MAKPCWICLQKAEYKAEKLKAARAAAKLQANEQGKTMVIIKEGCNYQISAIGASGNIIEYVSQHN